MTMQQPHTANATRTHFLPEPFDVFAAPELAAAPYWQVGVCLNPLCQRDFSPRRAWQKFCCDACKRAFNRELDRWGSRLALPALLWRIGKYEQQDLNMIARTRAARRYVTQVQSSLLAYQKHCAGTRAEKGSSASNGDVLT